MTNEDAMAQADKSLDALVATMEAERIEAEAHEEHMGFKVADLRKAFEGVQDPADWRAPIDAWVSPDEVALVLSAIHYFTATIGSLSGPRPEDGKMNVKSVGYRCGPAGP